MKILVTGSSGYLGRHAVMGSLDRGFEVVGLDVKPSGIAHPLFHEVIGDVTEPSAVHEAAEGCGAVLHLAAALAQFERDEGRMREVNVGGTANALAAALERGAGSFVFVSSVEVYGIDVPFPCSEEAPLRPMVQYGRDKVECEAMCAEYLGRGLDVVVLRPPTINGPGQNEPFLVSQMEAISHGKATLMPSGGKTRLQMVYAGDVVDAMFLCLDNPAARGLVANVASDDVPTLKELALALYEHAGTRARFINVPAGLARAAVKALSRFGLSPIEPQHLEIALRDYVFDNSRARSVLGWRPTRNDTESAIEAYDWHLGRQGSEAD